MDPSEFEGTVEKRENALSAGVLEEFLQSDHQKEFVQLDLNKECGDIYLSAYNLKEYADKWGEIDLPRLNMKWDEEAIQIATLKEEYFSRRKSLAKEVKSFNATYINSAEITTEILSSMKSECTNLIEKFKSEFDFLANAYKFSESAFLEVYKALRDAPDPTLTMEKNLEVCLHTQEVLKFAQEQLVIAAAKVEHANLESKESASSVLNQYSEEDMQLKFEEKYSEIIQKHQTEIADLRSRFDLELRSRENEIRGNIERQQLELSQKFESSLAAKDAEIASVLTSLQEATHRILEAEEREKTLEVEIQKRRELEEKIRICLAELGEERNVSRDLQSKLDFLQSKYDHVESGAEKTAKELKLSIDTASAENVSLKSRVKALEFELDSRPPIDLTSLAANVGMGLGVGYDSETTASDGKSMPFTGNLTWAKLESQIINSVRQSSSAAVEARVREQETRTKLEDIEAEFSSLKSKLQEKVDIIASLERDLLVAHSSVESSTALLKCYQPANTKGSTGGASHVNSIIVGGSNSIGAPPSPNASAYVERAKTGRFSGRQGSSAGASTSDSGTLNAIEIGNDCNDLEIGSGGKGTAAAVIKGLDSSDRLIQAVQHQRDRYMKIAKDKEVELESLRSRMDRLQDEQSKLKDENMELYRRLRVLRVNNKNGNQNEGDVTPGWDETDDMDGGILIKSRLRQRDRPPGSEGDVIGGYFRAASGSLSDHIDSKYSKLYEDQIDPFRMEELDRQAFISKLNVLERGIAFIMRMFLQDPWARQAFMVYIVMMHLFAIGYVFQVLNPQLIEEVDYYTKLKYSTETFNIDMSKEHPDIR